MKKKIFVFLILISSFVNIYAKSILDYFDVRLGIATGFPFYGDGYIGKFTKSYESSNYNRVLAGLSFDTNLKMHDYISFVLGADVFGDFLWRTEDLNNKYMTYLDYGFYGGLKIYPGLKGFNFGLAYLLGSRADFTNIDVLQDITEYLPWGNGFRISLEYDIAYNTSGKIRPAFGVYYKVIPRGNYIWDNIVAAYLVFPFK